MMTIEQLHEYVCGVLRDWQGNTALSRLVKLMAAHGVCTGDEAASAIAHRHRIHFVCEVLYERDPRGVAKVIAMHRMGVRS